jgi:hypothetical protein
MQTKILPEAESRAAEILFEAARQANDALQAYISLLQGDGQVQRVAPGVWAVSTPEPEASE